MDKYEYKLRSEELLKLIDEEKYAEAVVIADAIDWRRVRSITMLLRVGALYRVNRRNEDSRAILLLAYERYPSNRSVVYSLCEVAIELDDVVAAIEYYKEFVKLAPRDNGVFTLRYRILEAQEASLEERIELLEELKKRDYQEEWAYELAYLYHRVGLATKCIEECDDLILWFGDGPYVTKAMELKMLHAPLTQVQQTKYDIAIQQLHEPVYQEEQYYEDQYQDEGQYDREQASYHEQEQYVNEEASYNNNEEEQYAQASDEQEYYQDDAYYHEQEEVSYQDDNTVYADTQPVKQDTPAIDLSQYNTINLQKVVADSMRELFPDDDFFGDSHKYEEEALQEEAYIASDEQEENPEYAGKPLVSVAYEAGQDTQSTLYEEEYKLTEVSKELSEPHTGAIKRVVLPGDDAVSIKSDMDIAQIRALTDETVNEEQERYVQEEVNVFQPQGESVSQEEQGMAYASEEELAAKPITGQMNLDEVLSEWERMKKENEEKRKEQVRQLVLQQTGPLLENFDQSIRTGALGELSELTEIKTKEEPQQVRTETIFEDDGTEELEEIEDSEEILVSDEELYEEEVIENLEEDLPQTEITDISQDIFVEENMEESGNVENAREIEELEEIIELSEEAEEPFKAQELEDETDNFAEETETFFTDEEAEIEAVEEAGISDEEEGLEEEQSFIETAVEKELGGFTENIPQDELSEALEGEEAILKTQDITMNTAEITSLPDKIIAATKKETKGVKKEELREFTKEEQELFENFAVTKKIKKQILAALDKMSLASYTGNVIITGEPGLGTVRIAKNLIKEFQEMDANFSGKMAKISGERLNGKNLKQTFEKISNGAIIIEKANGMTEKTLYHMAKILNQDNLGVIVFMEDTKKEISRLLEKQAMIADYFNLRIDLMEMDNDSLVAFAKNYALELEYSIDELGTLALYTRIANVQSGNHVVTKNEVRDIVDEAIWKSRKFKIKNFVDVLFSKRYNQDDMIVLKERDFM